MINGATSKPFSAITLSPPEIRTSHKSEVIETSRIRFGRPRAEVERKFLTRNALREKSLFFQKRIF